MTFCGECGLRLREDTPPSVWTGHVHRPVSDEVMRAAVTVWAVAEATDTATGAVLDLANEAGISEQAMRMFCAPEPSGED